MYILFIQNNLLHLTSANLAFSTPYYIAFDGNRFPSNLASSSKIPYSEFAISLSNALISELH